MRTKRHRIDVFTLLTMHDVEYEKTLRTTFREPQPKNGFWVRANFTLALGAEFDLNLLGKASY